MVCEDRSLVGNTLNKITGLEKSMNLLDRDAHDLPVQKGEEKFRNKRRERFMVENIRPNYLPGIDNLM